jgi:ribosome modulation factor
MSDGATNVRILAVETARQEGYLAGRRGRTGSVNPYPGDTSEARAWLMGLLDGRTKLLRVVAGSRP